MNVSSRLAILCLLLTPQSALSGLASYECKVLHQYEVDSGGALSESKMMLQRSFAVDRSTGTIIDSQNIFTNTGDDVTLMDKGSAENAFQVFWTLPGFDMHVYFWIAEYVESETKPFHGIVKSWLVSGVCE